MGFVNFFLKNFKTYILNCFSFQHFHRFLTSQDFSFIKKFSHIFLSLASLKPVTDIEVLLFLKQLNNDIKMNDKLQEDYIKHYISEDLTKAKEIFDQSMLKKKLFSPKICNLTLSNVLSLLNYKLITSADEKLCLSRINYYLSDKSQKGKCDSEFRMICFLSILAKSENYSKEFKIEIIKSLLKLMDSVEDQSMDIRMAVINLSVSVLISKQMMRDGSILDVVENEDQVVDIEMKALED